MSAEEPDAIDFETAETIYLCALEVNDHGVHDADVQELLRDECSRVGVDLEYSTMVALTLNSLRFEPGQVVVLFAGALAASRSR